MTIRNPRILAADQEEMCARCGVQMVAGNTVVDVDTPDHDRTTYPYSVADWATAHAACVPPHPAACPYCLGTVVNQCEPYYLLRPARLDEDGTIVVGDVTDEAAFAGPNLLVCQTCCSTYVQPAEVPQVLEGALHVDYPESPEPGDPAYIGIGVAWTPTPVPPEVVLSGAVKGEG